MSCGSLTIARFLECNSYCVSLAVWILLLFYMKTTDESYNNVLVAVSLISSYWYQLVFNLNVKRMPIGWLVESLAKKQKTKKKHGTSAYLRPGVPLCNSVGQAVTQWISLLIGFVEGGPKPISGHGVQKLLAAPLLRRNSRVDVHCL